MKKCVKCKLESNHLRRGMCLKCYRLYTGLSGGNLILMQLTKELEKVKQRICIIEQKIDLIISLRKENENS